MGTGCVGAFCGVRALHAWGIAIGCCMLVTRVNPDEVSSGEEGLLTLWLARLPYCAASVSEFTPVTRMPLLTVRRFGACYRVSTCVACCRVWTCWRRRCFRKTWPRSGHRA